MLRFVNNQVKFHNTLMLIDAFVVGYYMAMVVVVV